MAFSPLSDSDAAASDVFDVLIVGGGLVGASLAIALDGSGRRVGLIEATPPGAMPAVFDERNLSFAEATVHALTALGVMQCLAAPTGAIRRIHASRAGDFGRVLLDARDHGRAAFGQVVVARDFGAALEARLADCRSLVRLRPARVVSTALDGDVRTVQVQTEAGNRTLRTRLLVAADGTQGPVRGMLGIAADTHDYGHHLLVARLRTSQAPDGTAYERLGPHGPTALLPRGDRAYGLVLGVPDAEVDDVMALDDAAFLARAQGAFGWRAGAFEQVGARHAYPARRQVAAALTAPRAVLVGNAAQTLHPVGAQGFNLGLRDALTLAELLGANPGDAGDAALLARHAARRGDDRAQTLQFSDALARIGALPGSGAGLLRSAALAAIGRLPSLRDAVVGGALGYRGQVPALCRRPA